MNLAQATNLKRGKFSYQSHLDGYQVRRLFKNRKKGEVEFEIYAAYREHFERYLSWRRAMLPHDDTERVFSFVLLRSDASPHARDFILVRRKCKELKVAFVGPQKLRAARVNWLLRRSRDPDLIAEMAQHTQETLIRDYAWPNHQLDSEKEHPALAVIRRVDDKLKLFEASSAVRRSGSPRHRRA